MNQLSRRIQLALFISTLAAAQPFLTPAPLDPVFRGQAPCLDEIEGLEARAARHGQRASVMLAVRPTMLPGPWRASVADFEREARDLHALHNRLVGEYWTYARAVARYACQGSCAGRLHNVKAGMLPLVREQQRILHAGLARTHADLGNAFARISRAAEGGLGQADLRPPGAAPGGPSVLALEKIDGEAWAHDTLLGQVRLIETDGLAGGEEGQAAAGFLHTLARKLSTDQERLQATQARTEREAQAQQAEARAAQAQDERVAERAERRGRVRAARKAQARRRAEAARAEREREPTEEEVRARQAAQTERELAQARADAAERERSAQEAEARRAFLASLRQARTRRATPARSLEGAGRGHRALEPAGGERRALEAAGRGQLALEPLGGEAQEAAGAPRAAGPAAQEDQVPPTPQVEVVWHPEAWVEFRRAAPDAQEAIAQVVGKLEERGEDLKPKHAKAVTLSRHLRELRPRGGRSPWRPLYVRSGQRFLILTLAHKADFQNGVDRAERRAPA